MNFDVGALAALAAQHEVAFEEAAEAVESAVAKAYHKTPGAVAGATARLDEASGNLYILDQDGNDITPQDFSRGAANAAKQAMITWLRDIERVRKLGWWAGTEGLAVLGTVKAHAFRNAKGETVLSLEEGAEGVLTAGESVPGEVYEHGQKLSVLVIAANVDDRGRPKISVSRRQPALVTALFAAVVPEMETGEVEVLSVVREAGSRSKIGVWGEGALAAMVGPNGERVRRVADALGGEKIDIVVYPGDMEGYIAAALTPGKVVRVEMESEKSAVVYAEKDQMGLVLGQTGRNVRMVSKLTGVSIRVEEV